MALKIAFIGIKGLPSRGGAERVVEAIVERLKEKHDLTVYCNSRYTPEGTKIAGVMLNRIPTPQGKYLQPVSFFLFSALHALFFGSYDLVHVHNMEACFVLPFLLPRFRVIATAHGQPYRMGLRRTLSVGLFLARDLIGIDLPELVLTYMESDPAAKRLSGELSLRLFQDPDNPTRIYKDQYLYLRMRERFVDKVRYLRYLTFTPNVKDWQLLGPRGHYSPVYALIRPFRLIGKYGLRLLKCIWGDVASKLHTR